MEGLIVIHTEMGYLDPNELYEDIIRNNIKLFEAIAIEVQKYLQAENRVYYLAEKSNSPDSKLIYPAIRQHSSRMVYVPNGIAQQQFLRAKEQVMTDSIDQIAVCGVAYKCCIRDIYHLLLGEENPNVTKERYQMESEVLGWSNEKFEQIFNTKLNAHIRDELTDKLLI